MKHRRIARWCCLATIVAIAVLVAFRAYSTYAQDAKVEEPKPAEHGMYAYPPSQVLDTYGISPVGPAPGVAAAASPVVQPSVEGA